MIYGASTIVVFIAWLITLITGKLPTPLHLAFTAVLRYQTRYYCYLGMLTPTYPGKLFGDEPDVSAPVTAAPAETAPPAESAETATPAESAWGAPPADWTPPAYGTTPAYGTAPGYGPPGYGTRATAPPRVRHAGRLRRAVRVRHAAVRQPSGPPTGGWSSPGPPRTC